jgi:hypothetical protein
MNQKNIVVALFPLFALAPLAGACGAASEPQTEDSVATEQPLRNIGLGAELSKDDLEGQGYTCEYVATGFWECTKPGSTTYWCDSYSCAPAPFRRGGGVIATPIATSRPSVSFQAE